MAAVIRALMLAVLLASLAGCTREDAPHCDFFVLIDSYSEATNSTSFDLFGATKRAWTPTEVDFEYETGEGRRSVRLSEAGTHDADVDYADNGDGRLSKGDRILVKGRVLEPRLVAEGDVIGTTARCQ